MSSAHEIPQSGIISKTWKYFAKFRTKNIFSWFKEKKYV